MGVSVVSELSVMCLGLFEKNFVYKILQCILSAQPKKSNN